MRLTPIVTLFAAGAVALAACGGDNGGTAATTAPAATTAAASTTVAAVTTVARTTTTSAATRPAATTTTTTPPPVTTAATGAATTGASGAATTNPNSVESVTEKATAALLAAGEIGPGFATDTFTPTDPSDPGVCGETSIDASVPPGVHVGTVIVNQTTGQALLEEVRVYTDEEEAMTAYNAALAAINCTTGSITQDDGTTQAVTISDPIDVAAQVGGDEATGWQLSSTDTQGVAIIVRLQAAIVTFQFQAPAGSEATDPAPLDVAKLGVSKVNAA